MAIDLPGMSGEDRPVLLIEDHADTRHMVEEFLTFSGVPVVAAENGAEGLKRLEQHRPSVVLLDLTMPVMDGWRFREEQLRLRDATLANVPVVILSAIHDCEREADRLGAVDVVPKPIDFDRMLAIVRRYQPT
ncbi:MAG: response regulator [Vicinamibacterales bacterium]